METSSNPESAGFSWQGPKLRVWPILLVVVICLSILAASFTAGWAILVHVDASLTKRFWPLLSIAELFELLFALVGISIARRYLPNADFGVRWPRGKTLVGKAVVWGIAFAAIMLLSDHGANLVHRWAPEAPDHSPIDVAGRFAFDLLLVGLCEETLFRGLLLGVLEARSPSRVRFGTLSISTAGVTIALLFALAHAASFATEAWPVALGQQVYAFAVGVLYAWMRERSGSLLAPIVLHGISDFVEDAVVFALAILLPHAPH
jgi:membrane protease YdiL (CAAX protease family)